MSRLNTRREGQTALGTDNATACFSVSASVDPGVMPRIIELFAKRGLVPFQMNTCVTGAGMDDLQIDLQMVGLSPAETEQFAQSMRQIVCVERVLTSTKQTAEQARP